MPRVVRPHALRWIDRFRLIIFSRYKGETGRKVVPFGSSPSLPFLKAEPYNYHPASALRRLLRPLYVTVILHAAICLVRSFLTKIFMTPVEGYRNLSHFSLALRQILYQERPYTLDKDNTPGGEVELIAIINCIRSYIFYPASADRFFLVPR